MVNTKRKEKVALLSIVSNTLLIILKMIAGIVSGSVSIISEAIHSGMDLVAAIIAYFSVRVSSKPADEDHPYGHGKIENISGVIEGLLIFVAAILIIKEGIEKLVHPSEVAQKGIAMLVMGISAVVNIFVSKKLYKVAKEEDSVALEADALHLKTDVYTSAGVGVGMALLIIFPQFKLLDPIIAILVALLIIKESWSLCRNAFRPLLDAKLSDEEEENIKHVLEKYNDEIIDFHSLRTRKSGHIKYIDFHLTVQRNFTVEEAHNLADKIENDIEENIMNTNVNIHIEPGTTNEKNDYNFE